MRVKIRKPIAVIGFVIWVVLSLVLVASLYSEHFLAFSPNSSLAVQSQSSGLSITHVLGVGCKCSEVVSQHLIKRSAKLDIQESVIIIGRSTDLVKRLSAKGYLVQEKEADFLQASGIETGVPFMVISNSGGQVLYSGGYGDHKIVSGSPILDLEILENIRSGRSAKTYPIFGCATSAKFKSLLDPFRMKYRQAERSL